MLIEALLTKNINGFSVSALLVLTTMLTPFFISIILWAFPLTVSKYIIKPELDQKVEPLDKNSLLTVLILAIGLYVFYYAAIDSVYWATIWNMSSESRHSGPLLSLNEESKANMVATGVELVAAIFIILNASTLSAKMLKLVR